MLALQLVHKGTDWNFNINIFVYPVYMGTFWYILVIKDTPYTSIPIPIPIPIGILGALANFWIILYTFA